MERESNPMQALCRSGCGFYGNPATDGLCSLCFKVPSSVLHEVKIPSVEALKKKQQPPVTTPSSSSGQFSQGAASLASLIDTATAQPTVPCASKEVALAAEAMAAAAVDSDSAAEAAAANSDDGSDGKDDKDGKKKKNRCATCRKKVGLTGFQCRCGGLYCAVHRYSDKHECSFDYREMGAAEIRRNNPVVVGEKIQKI